jgi:hypothetical protein
LVFDPQPLSLTERPVPRFQTLRNMLIRQEKKMERNFRG